MPTPRHPKKEIREVLKKAVAAGWVVEKSKGGRSKTWGQLRCGSGTPDECRKTVASTPRNLGTEAKELRKFMKKCPHR